MKNQKHLLPIGFYDLLGDEAKLNQETINLLLSGFYANNYQLIKTPLVEFEESLLDKDSKWRKIDDQSFKMVDNFSGKTLVLRSDITPQIARLVATKLNNSPMPLRLCYVGDVLKMKNDDLYADRQLTQVGIELIGEDSCASNLEVIDISLSALKKIKLSNLTINFCCPNFLDILLDEINFKNANDLRIALVNKNISAIKNLGGELSADLITLALESKNFHKINESLEKFSLNESTKRQINNWQKTIEDVQKNHPEIGFSLDIFGDDEFLYHNQIGFSIFADEFSYPITRGGRYMINQNISAVGSTIYINNLRHCRKFASAKNF
jgi:ATP phosphoribosyltransferase regulatory subunit